MAHGHGNGHASVKHLIGTPREVYLHVLDLHYWVLEEESQERASSLGTISVFSLWLSHLLQRARKQTSPQLQGSPEGSGLG